MCQTEVLSRSIISISKRSFDRQLDILSHSSVRVKGALTRLNNQLNELYEQLYDAYPQITEADYRVLQPYLCVLIKTLKDLHSICKKNIPALMENVKRLQMNISAIEELEADIRNFKINIFQNPRYNKVLERAKSFSCV